MTNTEPRSAPARADLARRELTAWLVERALPLWSRHGVDRLAGGFHEKLGFDLHARDEPRRTRVVARQVYVYALAARHRWLDEADCVVEHGLRFLFARMRLPEGHYAAAVDPGGSVVRPQFDLYEQAFVLFALAAARRERADRAELEGAAAALLQHLRERYGHPRGGFDEALPRVLPLRSNPHMHLFEAALEWSAAQAGGPWDPLADEIAELALERYIDPRTGAVHEHFDADWRSIAVADAAPIEPGHQFEWAWLLMRWGQARRRPDALRAASRLLQLGEQHGIDPARDAAVGGLDARLAPCDGVAKLWPQTERLKAWCLALRQAPTQREALQVCDALARAAATLQRFLAVEPAGLWREQGLPDGRYVDEPSRASSFYHVVGAIDALEACAPLLATLRRDDPAS